MYPNRNLQISLVCPNCLPTYTGTNALTIRYVCTYVFCKFILKDGTVRCHHTKSVQHYIIFLLVLL